MNFESTAPLGIAFLGLLMGMRHATDPDHVIAVTTIVSRESRLTAASRVGIVWGLGHTLTVMAVGAAIIIFKIAIPIRLGLAMEFAVAIVLVLLGLGAFASLVQLIVMRIARTRRAVDQPLVHSHTHGHGFGPHRHPHVHLDSGERHGSEQIALHHEHSPPEGALSSFAIRRPLLRSFGVGLVHGLAGSAAIALLVLSAIPQPLWATLYLGIFCLGTIVGMGLITTAIATPFAVAAQRTSWMHQSLVTGSGLLSFGFGLLLAYQLGIVDHLFSTVPIWTPH
jgi:ABC-type nickel/cobalt efflux system permease component RcnA